MKKFKEVLPCGLLRTDGCVYWLLYPAPVEKESWQHDFQQRWVVTPFDHKFYQVDETKIDEEGDFYRFRVYDYARHIVCSDPLIEYRNMTETIKVLWIDEEYNRIPEPEQFEPEPKDLEFARDLFLKEVGAMTAEQSEEEYVKQHQYDFVEYENYRELPDDYLEENQTAIEMLQEGLSHG